jgi:hypothetical protein
MDSVALKLRRFLRTQGLQILSIKRSGGGHYKATVNYPQNGQTIVIVLPSSPSDHRWQRNVATLIRRKGRQLTEETRKALEETAKRDH